MIMQDYHFVMMASDPSSNFVGFAFLIVDSRTMKLDFVYTSLIDLKYLDVGNDTHPAVDSRIRALRKRIIPLLQTFKPKVFAYERAFNNVRTPGAFEPLVASTTVMKQACLDFNPTMNITAYSPGQVKNALGQKGNCKKEVMKEACRTDMRINQFVDVNLISEHEIDAIAVGLCCLDSYRDVKVLLL